MNLIISALYNFVFPIKRLVCTFHACQTGIEVVHVCVCACMCVCMHVCDVCMHVYMHCARVCVCNVHILACRRKLKTVNKN